MRPFIYLKISMSTIPYLTNIILFFDANTGRYASVSQYPIFKEGEVWKLSMILFIPSGYHLCKLRKENIKS